MKQTDGRDNEPEVLSPISFMSLPKEINMAISDTTNSYDFINSSPANTVDGFYDTSATTTFHNGGTGVWDLGYSSPLTRKKITLKCCKCGKELGSFYGFPHVLPNCYCKRCHKIEKLKE